MIIVFLQNFYEKVEYLRLFILGIDLPHISERQILPKRNKLKVYSKTLIPEYPVGFV